MNQILQNLITAAQKAKTQQAAPNHCQWCNAEIPHADRYCQGTDCEYDGEKWRRAHCG